MLIIIRLFFLLRLNLRIIRVLLWLILRIIRVLLWLILRIVIDRLLFLLRIILSIIIGNLSRGSLILRSIVIGMQIDTNIGFICWIIGRIVRSLIWNQHGLLTIIRNIWTWNNFLLRYIMAIRINWLWDNSRVQVILRLLNGILGILLNYWLLLNLLDWIVIVIWGLEILSDWSV